MPLGVVQSFERNGWIMKKSGKLLALGICGALITSGLTACSSSKLPKGTYTEDENVIENADYADYIAKADSYLENCSFQGSVLVTDGDKIVLAKGYGFADEKTGTLNTANTTFEIGSMSKQITAAAVLQLYEQGKLSLDDTIDKYFPDFIQGKKITVSDLLHMRSGLNDFIDCAAMFFSEELADDMQKASTGSDINAPDLERDFFVRYLNDAPLRGEPNEEFYYCNCNYNLLALIVEQVSGMKYEDYLEENIFKPCGMKSTNGEFLGTDSRGYYADGTTESLRVSFALGCGSLNSNVYDFYRWNTGLLNGAVLGEKGLEEMLKPIDGYGCGVFSQGSTIIHGGCTCVYNSYSVIYKNDNNSMVLVFENRPIQTSDSSYVANNLKKLME